MPTPLGEHTSSRQSKLKLTVYRDKNQPFEVRGHRYPQVGSLSGGLLVVQQSELYPCFDASDYATENRYYHWLFPCRGIGQYLSVKQLLARKQIPLRQLWPSAASTDWARQYEALTVSMVYFEDGMPHLIVIEPV